MISTYTHRRAALLCAAAIFITCVFSVSLMATDSLSAGQAITFPDVYESDWFYADVTRLSTLGIVNGYPDGMFYPEREITNAEFIKILMASEGVNPDAPVKQTLFAWHWASPYLSLAHTRGIITDADLAAGFDPEAPITRAAMTRMMILALGIEPARIDDPFTDISDIYASTAYNEYLLRGYLMEDDTRIYDGDSNASRSEAAAIAVRIIEYRENAYEYKKNAILENARENPLNNEFELLDLFYILNREFMTEFTFESAVDLDTCMEYYLHANVIHLEYFYSSRINCRYYPAKNRYEITLEYDDGVEALHALHTASVEKADRVVASIITDGMSGMDKIKAIHDYLILNCAYDYENYILGEIPLESRLAHGVLVSQKAVCQGYSAAFNLLCERAGIRSVGINGYAPGSPDEHAWNMFLVDGQIYYMDVTHDDPVPDQKGRVSYRFYYLTEAEMITLGYTWDRNQSNLKYLY